MRDESEFRGSWLFGQLLRQAARCKQRGPSPPITSIALAALLWGTFRRRLRRRHERATTAPTGYHRDAFPERGDCRRRCDSQFDGHHCK